LRKVPEKEARELVATIGQARSYMQHNLWEQIEASLYRLYHVENRLREILGEQQIPHQCYHQCQIHKPKTGKESSEMKETMKKALEIEKFRENQGREIFGLPPVKP